MTDELGHLPLPALLERVASHEAVPGAGPTLAWTCGFAAALVAMVCEVGLRREDDAAMRRRLQRAGELHAAAVRLATQDAEAYGAVMAVLGRRDEPGHGARLREALSAAADPPLEIARAGAEVTALAADAAAAARGGVRGEAVTAAVLGEAVVRAVVPVVEMNLGGARDDPRLAEAAELARRAAADLQRARRPSRRS